MMIAANGGNYRLCFVNTSHVPCETPLSEQFLCTISSLGASAKDMVEHALLVDFHLCRMQLATFDFQKLGVQQASAN